MSVNEITLSEYLRECVKYCDIDIHRAEEVTRSFIKYHNNKKISQSSIQEMILLQERWYESLKRNNPDYSVYSDPYYFCEVWLCWVNYSKRYLKDICKKTCVNTSHTIVEDIGSVKSVVDLGCSFGYTTAVLKSIFKNANVYGTNIKDSYQYKMAESYGKQYEFKVVDDISNMKADLVFASEYFEHFERPIEHLDYVIKTLQPKYLLIANTFNGKAIGHFDVYKHHSYTMSAKNTSKEFGKFLRNNFYRKINTNCWNNRPQYWKKEDGNTLVDIFQ